jgi:hypothetical protein
MIKNDLKINILFHSFSFFFNQSFKIQKKIFSSINYVIYSEGEEEKKKGFF